MPSNFFDNLFFSLSVSHLRSDERKEISEIIKKNGGTVVLGFPNETTHLVAGEKEINEKSFRVKSALSKGAYVVLPSFIIESGKRSEKVREWDHMLIGGKRAGFLARDEEELVLNSFSSGISRVYALAFESKTVERSVSTAVRNISSICAAIMSRYVDSNPPSNLKALISTTFRVMRTGTARTEDFETVSVKSSSSSKKAQFTSKRPPVSSSSTKQSHSQPISSITSSKIAPSALQLSVEKRRLESEEKARRIKEEQDRKLAERKSKEEERARKEEERRRRAEETLQRLEEQRRLAEENRIRAEEERDRLLQEMHENTQRMADRFLNHESDLIDREGEEEEGISLQEQLRMEMEQKKNEEKLRRKKEKKAKTLAAIKQRKIDRKNEIAEKENRKKELEQRKIDEEERIKEAKETARREYQERQVAKNIRALIKANKPPPPPKPPSDDNRKMFVGGVNFDDLTSLATRQKENQKKREQKSEEGPPRRPKRLTPEEELKRAKLTLSDVRVAEIKSIRLKGLMDIFKSFGKVEKVKGWDQVEKKQCCFVIYENEEDCENAIKTLSDFEKRKEFTKKAKEELESRGTKEDGIGAPSAHYYVRVVKSLANQKKKSKERKQKEVEKPVYQKIGPPRVIKEDSKSAKGSGRQQRADRAPEQEPSSSEQQEEDVQVPDVTLVPEEPDTMETTPPSNRLIPIPDPRGERRRPQRGRGGPMERMPARGPKSQSVSTGPTLKLPPNFTKEFDAHVKHLLAEPHLNYELNITEAPSEPNLEVIFKVRQVSAFLGLKGSKIKLLQVNLNFMFGPKILDASGKPLDPLPPNIITCYAERTVPQQIKKEPLPEDEEEPLKSTPLHELAVSSDVEYVKKTLSSGCREIYKYKFEEGWLKENIDVRNPDGFTPLLLATMCGDVEIVKAFLDAHSYPSKRQYSTYSTPLHQAARNGNIRICRLLLGAKADTDLIDKDGNSPIVYAAEFGHLDIVKLLVESGTTNGMQLALSRATANGHVAVQKYLKSVETLTKNKRNQKPGKSKAKPTSADSDSEGDDIEASLAKTRPKKVEPQVEKKRKPATPIVFEEVLIADTGRIGNIQTEDDFEIEAPIYQTPSVPIVPAYVSDFGFKLEDVPSLDQREREEKPEIKIVSHLENYARPHESTYGSISESFDSRTNPNKEEVRYGMDDSDFEEEDFWHEESSETMEDYAAKSDSESEESEEGSDSEPKETPKPKKKSYEPTSYFRKHVSKFQGPPLIEKNLFSLLESSED